MIVSSINIEKKKLAKNYSSYGIKQEKSNKAIDDIFSSIINFITGGQRKITYQDISNFTNYPPRTVKIYVAKLINCGAVTLVNDSNIVGQNTVKFEFKKGKGVCGILKPTGRFTYCSYGGHCELLKKIPKNIQLKCLWFSSKLTGDNSNSAVGCEDWNYGITQKQYNWIVKHKKYFDNEQLICLNGVFKGHIKIIG